LPGRSALAAKGSANSSNSADSIEVGFIRMGCPQ
jgi:hypothetical protein